jgi:hypothetical protein
MRDLGWWKKACAVIVLCAATAIGATAQTFIPVFNFDESNVPVIENSVNVASWTPLAELAPSQNNNASSFGLSVSVSGRVAVVGSDADSDLTGAAYVFVQPSGGSKSVTQTAKLTASDGQPGDGFGDSVSISGNIIVVGALAANSGQGRAYIFVEPPNGWTNMTETAQLTASDGQPNDQFGTSVAISGGTVAVGAPGHSVGSNPDQGASYVFVQPAGGWVNMNQTAELTASDGTMSSVLGISVAVSGNTVIAGADGASAAYVFVQPAGGWANMTQTAKLTDGKEIHGDFGFAVAISGNTIVVGSPYGSNGRGPAGAAHVYVKTGGDWKTTRTPTATLLASDGGSDDQLGYSVSTTGETVLAGAPNVSREQVLGVAYGFAKPTGGWVDMTQSQELVPSNGVSFGESVASNGPAALVGAVGTNTAYVYQYASNSGFTGFSVPGSSSTSANGVNNLGQIVGYSDMGGFLDTNGVFTTIAYPGAQLTTPEGINDSGEVVGMYIDSSNVWHGFTELNGSYTSFDYPGGTDTTVFGINNLGDLAGQYADSNGGHGFLYSNGVFTPINVPGAGGTFAYAVNNDEATAGKYCVAPCNDFSGSGFVFSNDVFTQINYPRTAVTVVRGINDNGNLAGTWSNSPLQVSAFVFWSENQQFVGFNLGGPESTSANGINNSNEIVGGFCPNGTAPGPCYGFYGHLPGH